MSYFKALSPEALDLLSAAIVASNGNGYSVATNVSLIASEMGIAGTDVEFDAGWQACYEDLDRRRH